MARPLGEAVTSGDGAGNTQDEPEHLRGQGGWTLSLDSADTQEGHGSQTEGVINIDGAGFRPTDQQARAWCKTKEATGTGEKEPLSSTKNFQFINGKVGVTRITMGRTE